MCFWVRTFSTTGKSKTGILSISENVTFPSDDVMIYVIGVIGVRGGGRWGGRPPGLKNFRANSVFRASASCSKILNDKKCIFSTVKNSRATQFFKASASCSKILNVKSIFNTVKILGQLFFFSGQAQVVQKSWTVKKFSIVYIHLGLIRVIWVSAVCNLDQSRDRL